MALYWPEARFALDLMEGEVPRRSESEYPPGVLVLSVREEQVDDPEFLEEARELIIRRTERFAPRHPASGRRDVTDGDGGAAPEGAKTVHGVPSISEPLRGTRLQRRPEKAGRRALLTSVSAARWRLAMALPLSKCAAGTVCDQRLRGRHREARAGLADASPPTGAAAF